MEAYRGFWDAQVTAYADPDAPVPESLRRYAIDTARTDKQAAVLYYRQQGIEWRGKPVLTPRATSISLGDPPRVSITDCVDSTSWAPVFAATGKSARASGQPLRVVVESMATVYDNKWVIRASTVFRDRTC